VAQHGVPPRANGEVWHGPKPIFVQRVLDLTPNGDQVRALENPRIEADLKTHGESLAHMQVHGVETGGGIFIHTGFLPVRLLMQHRGVAHVELKGEAALTGGGSGLQSVNGCSHAEFFRKHEIALLVWSDTVTDTPD